MPDSFPSADTGLSCPKCRYNLTGLQQPRCPECGESFDWNEVRRATVNPPKISFEKARGWRRLPAFFITWVAVLFTPWIFARQTVDRINPKLGLLFGAACFIPMTAHYVYSGFDPAYFAWISAAAVYIIAQALIVSLLDPHGWRHPKQTFSFWLAVGGYTSAVVVTECLHGAPLMSVYELHTFYADFLIGRAGWRELYDLVESPASWLGWMQIIIWLTGLAFCYSARLRAASVSKTKRVLAITLCVLLLLHLYALCVDPIGTTLYDLYGG